MKGLNVATLFAFVVLAAAAVWLGGLNQDEGWYLYAAGCVADGRMPYRDFFYTQGPLMPIVYSAFAGVWSAAGLLGARVLTLLVGIAGLVAFAALAHRLAPEGRKREAAALVAVFLANNLYHLYYLAIPKTYALATLFVAVGFCLFARSADALRSRSAALFAAGAGFALAASAGTRISLGALLAVVGFALLLGRRQFGMRYVWFGLGGALGLALIYGPFLADSAAREGLLAAQRSHAARGDGRLDLVWAVGSLSRLVRWYMPVFAALAACAVTFLALRRKPALSCGGWVALAGFGAVFGVQMLAPFPYEDYQVPVMGLLAVFAALLLVSCAPTAKTLSFAVLAALVTTWCGSFGSPLLEKWMTDGQDRFWSLKKTSCELAQLRGVARQIEALDPGGKDLLTQDLYLAIETRRKVPNGLEMGPFAMLDDAAWRKLLESAPCKVAALSGYSFAVEPPACNERPVEQQRAYHGIVRKNYAYIAKVDRFGQNATTLILLKRKDNLPQAGKEAR